MKKSIISSWILFMLIFASCTSHKKVELEDEFSVEATEPESGLAEEANTGTQKSDASGDELLLSETDSKSEMDEEVDEDSEDLSLENELNSLDESPAKSVVKKTPPAPTPVVQEAPPAPVSVAQEVSPPPAKMVQEVPPTPVPVAQEVQPTPVPVEQEISPTPTPIVEEIRPETDKIATIDNIIYRANDNGGTVVISANKPLRFSTRLNSATNQFVVEIENSIVPNRLKRPLNTKDMASSIGSVDIYQNPKSNISRFVVQLRAGSAEPIVQPEGNGLLIIGAASTSVMAKGNTGTGFSSTADLTINSSENPMEVTSSPIEYRNQVSGGDTSNSIRSSAKPSAEIVDLASPGIMSSDDLEEFLISNNKFYGKKISIETSNKMDIKEAIKFISEESGVNIIIDESVSGNVSLKLKNIPWDQALILLLKSKKLGFKRQGTVLRIGQIADFKRDEDEAIAMKEARKINQPFVIKRFFIGYADITELEKKIIDYLAATNVSDKAVAGGAGGGAGVTNNRGPKGSVLADKRTSSLIVTDTEENIAKIAKLIAALDSQPQQVLIEGKVVEAQESFTRGLGVRWNSIPGEATSANRARIGINPIVEAGAVVLDSEFQWGQLDILGVLSARLQLGEREDKVRVLSSPRIAVLSNEKASISQTAGLLVPTSTTTNGGVVTVTNQVVPVGVNLNVTPLVSNEGTITLDIDIKRSFLARVDATTSEDRSAKTKVIVKSGQTAVIGGIFESEARAASSGVPGFKDLPILGQLFKSQSEAKSKSELVIFVTPTILRPVAGSEKMINDIQ